ncbi:hypothetical protein Tsubulata_038661 [Turnera subulata]|uniref:Expansin-like EG45 domain-containing protein n=1 Tax=Turnera subulata TaxID=218843 RepID=A0A9Q0JIT6_9ROSI|nr:hypothetical protein Tsubulata_038661 [Turnera subulata]
MATNQAASQYIFLFLLASTLFHLAYADIGTAAVYNPPYLPTACFGTEATQFPSSNLFAAAGEAIWDNGAACGRQYLVRCISSAVAGSCNPEQIIQVRIVDRALTSSSRPSSRGATIVLSAIAFGTISNPSARSVNVEYRQI